MSGLITYTAPSGLSLIIAMAGNVRAAAMVPTRLEIPEAGSSDLKIYLTLYDADGEMQVPDAAPTVAVVNDAGVSRSANLRNATGASTTMVNESVGVYWLYYRVTDTSPKEGLVFTFTAVCNTKTLTVKASSEVGDAREIDTKLSYISEELEIDPTFGTAEAGSDASHLVCSSLTRPSGDYVDWHLLMLTGVNAGLMRRVSGWSLTTHTLTLAGAFPGAIAAGDAFDLLSINASANRFVGQNDDNNEVDTSLVVANRDGSLLERVEDVRNLVDPRQMQAMQTVQINVISAANAGIVNLWRVTGQPCTIYFASVRAQSAAPSDLTSAGIYAGSGITTIVLAGLATQARLSGVGRQVGCSVLAELPVGDIVYVNLLGTGPTAVDLIITISYRADVDGGYLDPV